MARANWKYHSQEVLHYWPVFALSAGGVIAFAAWQANRLLAESPQIVHCTQLYRTVRTATDSAVVDGMRPSGSKHAPDGQRCGHRRLEGLLGHSDDSPEG